MKDEVKVPAVPEQEIASRQSGEPSASVRVRVSAARDIQLQRQGKPNALLSVKEIENHCVAEPQGQQLARQAITRLGLSARAYHRILKVARTIADLAGAATVSAAHVAEAVQYRCFERI
jgi:magnesium chelatase family protein